MERPNLRAGVVQDLDVGTESMVHGIGRTVISVGQVPQQIQHLTYRRPRVSLQAYTSDGGDLDCHDSLFVILCQVADELQQLLTLLLAGPYPTPLET